MWFWKALTLLHFVTKTWGGCDSHSVGSFGNRSYYICSQMTSVEYKTTMDRNMINMVGSLDLIQINITTIDQYLFSHNGYEYVYSLTIQQCNVTTIDNHSFDKLTQLLMLYIMENNIKHFDSEVLKPVSNLNMLDLSDNNIQKFTINCNHSKLQTLILNKNYITILHKDLFQNCDNDNLQFLYIQNASVQEIRQNTFSELKLHMLNLSKNVITNLELGAFTGLNDTVLPDLSLSFQNITLKKGTFLGLEKLNHINIIDSNKVELIESGAFEGLKSVRSFNIKSFFQNITKIKTEQFIGLLQLETLDLSDSSIQTIESRAFNGLNSLKLLKLNLNDIVAFPCDICEQPNVLENLNIANNQIENLNICAFKNFGLLNTLHLQFNKISYLKVEVFSALGQLRYLDVSHNKLSTLNELVLHPLDHIEVLNISANYFTHLNPETLFSHLKTLKQIDLSENHWICENLDSIRKYFRSRGIRYESKILNSDVENIGGIQCYDDINIKTTTKSNNHYTVLYSNREETEFNKTNVPHTVALNKSNIDEFNSKMEIYFNKTLNSLDKLLTEVKENNLKHDINVHNKLVVMLLTIFIVYVCIKIVVTVIKIYKRKLTKRSHEYNSNSTHTLLQLLQTENDSV